MTDTDDGLRRLGRREYLRQHAKARRTAERDQGERRIDVTLKGAMRDDYETVRRYIEDLNRIIADRRFPAPPIRLSDTEVIRKALDLAAVHIREQERGH